MASCSLRTTARSARSRTRRCIETVFPGLPEDITRNLSPAADDRADHRHRLLRQRPRHPSPGAARGRIHPRVDRRRHPGRHDARDRPLCQERICRQGRRHPGPRREAHLHPRGARRHAQLARVARGARDLQPLPEARTVLRASRGPLHDRRADGHARRRRRDRGRGAPGHGLRRRDRGLLWKRATRRRSRPRCAAACSRRSGRSSSASGPTSAPRRSSSSTSMPPNSRRRSTSRRCAC